MFSSNDIFGEHGMWLFLMECLAPHAAKDGHQQFVTRERSPEMGFDVRLSISGGGVED